MWQGIPRFLSAFQNVRLITMASRAFFAPNRCWVAMREDADYDIPKVQARHCCFRVFSGLGVGVNSHWAPMSIGDIRISEVDLVTLPYSIRMFNLTHRFAFSFVQPKSQLLALVPYVPPEEVVRRILTSKKWTHISMLPYHAS